MDALSQAAAEITAELADGSVDVRLRGREPQFVVDVPTVPMPAAAPTPRPARRLPRTRRTTRTARSPGSRCGCRSR